MVNPQEFSALFDKPKYSVSSTRSLWEVLRQQVRQRNPNLPLDYYVGFSHACLLVGVVGSAEWAEIEKGNY